MKREEVRKTFNDLMLGDYDFDEIYKFAKQLMDNGPTTEEVKGFIDSTADRVVELNPKLPKDKKIIDISSSGGDDIKTINVGSIVSLVLAAGGIVVGKNAARAVTGYSGSSDLFDKIGIPVKYADENVKNTERLLEKTGFASYYYPAFDLEKYGANSGRFLRELRDKGMSFVTPWNVAAWLYNPLKLNYRIYGMFTDKYFETAAEVLKDQGVEKGWIVYGADGLDEVSNVGETKVLEFVRSGNKELILYPEDFGLRRAAVDEIKVSSAEESFKIADNIINGKEDSAYSDLILINSSAGLYLTGLTNNLKDGVRIADELLKSGKVKAKVEEIKSEIRR